MSKESMEHFGLYSDSTMKSMTKDELIKYVHIIYENWESCDETSERIVEANMKLLKENELLKREVKALDEEGVQKCELNEKLSKALDKACKELSIADNFKEKYCSETLYRTNDKTFEEWKEWCMKDE